MASQHVLQVFARGLVTAPNPLLVPRDALIEADNIILDRPGLIQSRRGFRKYDKSVGSAAWAVAPWAKRIVLNSGSYTVPNLLVYNSSSDGNGNWGSITIPEGSAANAVASGERMQTAQAIDSLFLTCDQGVRKLVAGVAITAPFAGLPKCLGLDNEGPADVLTGASGFLADNYCVAYRAVIGRTVGTLLQLGSPSSRTLVANTAAFSGYSAGVARNTVCRVMLPKQANTAGQALDTSYFLQLYRSSQVENGQTPSDELQMVWEAYLSAADIAAGYVDITDTQPDSLRGAYLYTNPNTGEEGVRTGILNANEAPPNAWDVAWWRDCMWYADRTRGTNASGVQKQRLQVQLLGVGTGGLDTGDSLQFVRDNVTLLDLVADTDFALVTSGPASANIEATAANIVAAFNAASSQTGFVAFYVSGAAPDAPGKIVFESLTNTTAPIEFSCPTVAFMPQVAAGEFASTSADGAGNRLYFSKPGQPEAVPVVNFLEIGATGSNILRLIPLGNQLYVITDAGLYRVLGSDFTNFAVDPVDLTTICAAPQSAVTLDGSLYFLTNQGAVEVTEGNVTYISGDIDSDLRQVLSALLYTPATATATATLTFTGTAAPDQTVIINGYGLTIATEATTALTAAAMAAAINASNSPFIRGQLTASVVGSVVTLTAIEAGVEGNDITLDKVGNFNISSSTLLGGAGGKQPLAWYAFAVAHPIDHRILFWLPADTSAVGCKYAYVYDRRSRAWTRWFRGTSYAAAQEHSCGCYSQSGPTDVGLTLATAQSDNTGYAFVERRGYVLGDYRDELNDGEDIGIVRKATWAYQDNGDASLGKHWREVQFLFGDARPVSVTVTLTTEIQDAAGAVETASVGTTYVVPVNNKMHRLPVGMACGRSARLAVALLSADRDFGFDVAGMALHFRTFGPRLTRGP